MRFDVDNIGVLNNHIMLAFPTGAERAVEGLEKAIARGKSLTVEIKPKTQKRSLTANSALWAMLRDMAAVLRSSAQELYIVELQKYGVAYDMGCLPEAVDSFSKMFRLAINRGTYYHNGHKMVALQVFPGSSTYDSKQFSILLDGVINDAKELGVDFISEADKALMLEEMEHGNDESRIN